MVSFDVDESGSDTDGAGSGESTSSYSSLSDFVSELASSDLSPSGTASAVAFRRKSQRPHVEQSGEYDDEPRYEDFRTGDRNVTSLCSSLDLSTVYSPPSALQLPGEATLPIPPKPAESGDSASGSGSDSETSASSDDVPGSRRASSVAAEKRKSSAGEDSSTATAGTEQSQQQQHKPIRQGSFGKGGIFGQIANQAKELVKETKRQSSQEGLLSQVDKVSKSINFPTFPYGTLNYMPYFFISHS